MCGIAGYFQLNEPAPPDKELVGRMVAAIQHRGPDEMGICFNDRCVLGQARLSIIDLAGGTITSGITDIYPAPIKAVVIDVKYSHIDRLIGKQLDHELIKNILINLDIKIVEESGDDMKLEIPPYRVDVTREADVVEEVLRIYGYNNVEFSQKISASLSPSVKPDNELLVNQVSDFLASNGFNEIMSNSLTKSGYYSELKTYPSDKCVQVLNPLSSDLDVMRQTLLFNGLEAISYNLNRQNANLRLFEYGRCYSLSGKENTENLLKKYHEERRLSIFLTGNKNEPSWSLEDKKVSFFNLKAYCEKVIDKVAGTLPNVSITSLEGVDDIFSGGLKYSLNNNTLLEIGIVSPLLTKQFDIEQEVLLAEFRWDELLKLSGKSIQFKETSKFPEVRRDLALLINEEVAFSEIEALAVKTEKKLLKHVNLFDFFKGKGIADGKKSYGVSFYLQDDGKTLTDKEIDRIMGKLSDRLSKELGAELR